MKKFKNIGLPNNKLDTTDHNFCGAVKLHSACAEMVHGVHERDVLILKDLHVSNKVCLTVQTTNKQVIRLIWQ